MVELNYKKTGSGPPLVILHGLLGSLDNWQTLARMFGEKNTVYTVDQRNHGQSPHLPEMTFDVLSSDLLEFLDQHNLQNPVIMGHSMGGKTAMQFALQHPDRMSGLIVVDISPKNYRVHHDQILEALAAVNFDQMKSRKEIEDFLMERLQDRGVVFFLTKNVYWESNERLGYRFNLNALRDSIETISNWPDSDLVYQSKCLFVKGDNSNYIRNEEELRRQFPKAKLEVIQNSGHWVHAEQQEAFFHLIRNYLDHLKTS